MIADFFVANFVDDSLFYVRLANNFSIEKAPCVAFNPNSDECTNGFHPLYFLILLAFRVILQNPFYGAIVTAVCALVLTSGAIYKSVKSESILLRVM